MEVLQAAGAILGETYVFICSWKGAEHIEHMSSLFVVAGVSETHVFQLSLPLFSADRIRSETMNADE